MNRCQLSFRNITGNPFRSGLLLVCVLLVAGSAMTALLIIQGARENLQVGMSSMVSTAGEISVVPRGMGYSSVGAANVDLDALLEDLRGVPGVALASPQLTLLTVEDSPCCPGLKLSLIAFDPLTDFQIASIAPEAAGIVPGMGEAILGSDIRLAGDTSLVEIASRELKAIQHLRVTSTSLDSTILVTFETARELFLLSGDEPGSQVDASAVPIILVRFSPSVDPDAVTARILKDLPGISVINNAEAYRYGNRQFSGMLKTTPALPGLVWLLSVLFMGMVFSITANDRRREIGLLRSLGCTRGGVFRLLVTEGFLLALMGSLPVILFAALAAGVFGGGLKDWANLPLAVPSAGGLFLASTACLLVACLSVCLAVFLPAWRISNEDPEIALKG